MDTIQVFFLLLGEDSKVGERGEIKKQSQAVRILCQEKEIHQVCMIEKESELFKEKLLPRHD